LIWLAATVAGLALAAFVVVSWPNTGTASVPKTTAGKKAEVRTTAVARAEPAGVAGAAFPYPLELYYHELSSSPLLDAFISASSLAQPQQSYDAH
jgi:hypothetical protein